MDEKDYETISEYTGIDTQTLRTFKGVQYDVLVALLTAIHNESILEMRMKRIEEIVKDRNKAIVKYID